ncbi:MAG: dihydroorotase [Pyramidobacter sp.]|nr:dihydroorotase [Pyramidobacter sp.]
MNSILFHNVRLIDPALGMDITGSLLVKDGVIAAVGAELEAPNGSEIVECGGAVLCPGFVDLHVHFRDPGQTAKESLETGCQAAAAGGFTAVVTMANTKPAVDTPQAIRECIGRAAALDCRVYPAGSVTLGLAGKELTDFEGLAAAGAVALTDDGMTVGDGALFYEAMERSVAVGLPVSVHCEAPGFEGDRSMNRGAISQKLGLIGTPALAEELMIQRDLLFAEKSGAHVHVQHLSTARGVEMVAEAKRRGVRVTAEATPHHMTLDESAVLECGANAKMSPPLRTPADVEAVREGLMSGILDVIATDHAPHTPAEKASGLAHAPNGIIGLESSFAVCCDELCHKHGFPVSSLVERMSTAPRRIFNLPAVRLEAGMTADLVLFDPDRERLIDASRFKSKSRNCPYSGKRFKGAVLMTLLGGRITSDQRGNF